MLNCTGDLRLQQSFWRIFNEYAASFGGPSASKPPDKDAAYSVNMRQQRRWRWALSRSGRRTYDCFSQLICISLILIYSYIHEGPKPEIAELAKFNRLK
jgi:hypothetical protein